MTVSNVRFAHDISAWIGFLSNWSSSSLTLPEEGSKPIPDATSRRVLDDMQPRCIYQ